MLRLLFCVFLLSGVAQEASAGNLADFFNKVKAAISTVIQNIQDMIKDKCVADWLNKYSASITNCKSNTTATQIQLPDVFFTTPTKYPLLSELFGKLICTPSTATSSSASNAAPSCGKGWVKDGNWCVCRGTVSCAATTTPAPTTTTTTRPTTTTTRPTTTTTATTTTTKATTTTAATTTPPPTTTTTTVPVATTPSLKMPFAPIINCEHPADSVVTLNGHELHTFLCTITAYPRLNSISATLGSQTGTVAEVDSVGDIYKYRITGGPLDYTNNGIWTITADNGINPSSTYKFTVNIPVNDVVITQGPFQDFKIFAIPQSGLIVVQTYTCSSLQFIFAPQTFSYDDYTSYMYYGLYFDYATAAFYSFIPNGGETAYINLPNSICPPYDNNSQTPLWVLIQYNKDVQGLYNFAVWVKSQYDASPLLSADAAIATNVQLPYEIANIVFDVDVNLSNFVYKYYPTAV